MPCSSPVSFANEKEIKFDSEAKKNMQEATHASRPQTDVLWRYSTNQDAATT